MIVIISILASLLLPSLSKARSQAKTVVCAGNLKQLGIGIILYSDDNAGYLPQYHGSTLSELSMVREWFRFWKGYLASANIASTPTEERRQIWELGAQVKSFDCPTTNQLTNYGHQGHYPKTFDYRMSEHYRNYSASQPATGVGDPIGLYSELPPNGLWLIDSASKMHNEGVSGEPMSGNDHPSYALYPGGGVGAVYTSWFFTNTSTVPDYAAWPFVWSSPRLGNYSGSNYVSPGIHHRYGANILRPDGAARRYPIRAYLPELEAPISWRSMGRLVAGRVLDD